MQNTIERVDVSESASISKSIAERYATAVFDLYSDDKNLKQLETDIIALEDILSESEELHAVLVSPAFYSRSEQAAALQALSEKIGLGDVLTQTLQLMALKRRLFVVPQLIDVLKTRLADAKGEITVDIVSAKALTKTQTEKLSKTLKDALEHTVNINTAVDNTLIGGLIIKVGSRMIDTTVRARLNAIQNTMKEVG